MLSTRKVLFGIFAAALAMLSSLAVAQDYPTLGGNNGRTGKNSNPALYGPGDANLTWFWPNDLSPGGRGVNILRDNPSNQTLRTGTWTGPTTLEEAGYSFIAPNQTPAGNNPLDQLIGHDPFAAPYEYVQSTASALGSHNDPTTAAVPANLATFTWTMDPTQEQTYFPAAGIAPLYQLYVWLPNGPTGPLPDGSFIYPNRYYVFEILYGNGKRWIDVVDTNFAGQGWVRLGNGGSPTDKVFEYSGTPIQIRLYNTQWRDQFDNILEDNTVKRGVYADAAMMVPDRGAVTSTPVISEITTAGGPRRQVVTAVNRRSAVSINGTDTTITNSEVDAFLYNGLNGAGNPPIWKWSPIEVTPYTTFLDNNDATYAGGTWVPENITNHYGTDYRSNIITDVQANTQFATYAPTLDDGDYLIQVYCGGDKLGEQFGHATHIFIDEGPNTTEIPIDQSVPGWVTIGTRRFLHRDTIGEPLKLRISNYSADPADVGRKTFADGVRFIGAFNETINATPVQTKAFITPQGGGAPVERDVVLVAADDGHLYCLDAEGNGNGTTTLLWAYPSILPSGANPNTDPNAAVGEDGDGNAVLANMPSNGFGTSAPLVQRIGGVDYAYVAARNGRVYCIKMAGRGDYDATTGKIGTTSRQWSYPDDYPQFERNPIDGGFGGSLTYGDTAQGPTIFVPANQGRIYALDAVGPGNKKTNLRWAYPDLTSPTIGAVTTTPVYDFGRLYFGTAPADDTVSGIFYALNADNGNFVWNFTGGSVAADAFLGGPATATSAELGIANNMIFCSNQNLFVYGLDADTGAMLWETSEVNSGVEASLMFTWMNPYDTTGTRLPAPVVMVPTQDGRFDGLFARPGDTNIDGLKLAWEYIAGSDSVTAATSNGFNFMYGGDHSGNIYAWSSAAGIAGLGTPPGSETLVPNNPIVSQYFHDAKVTLITKKGYQLLRQSDTVADPTGNTAPISHDDFLNPANGYVRNTGSFEWGETVYLMVYDFAYLDKDPNGGDINPPVVQFQIGVEGSSVRQYGVQAKKFQAPYPPNKDGYAILAFPLQGGGPTTIPPGSATVKFSFQTSAANTTGTVQNVAVSGTVGFGVANPIGLIMPDPTTGLMGTGTRSFATTTNPDDIPRKTNGSRLAPTLAQSEGEVAHGQTGVGNFWVVDMSMMTLLKGPNRGLEQVRVTRPDLAWQGGAAAVYKPIDQLLYPGFEDLPVNYPNTSLDYPNLDREWLSVTKDPNGVPENAIVSPNGVALDPPNPYDESNILTRIVHPVLFRLAVDVPMFQPANDHTGLWYPEIGGVAIPSGYLSRMSVYVDSNGNSSLDSVSGRREAFRSWTTTLGVTVDEQVAVTTPTVDLGTLAETTGYSPLAPGAIDGKSLSPWPTGAYTLNPTTITTSDASFTSLFKPFHVTNPGNVNLLDLRLALGVAGGTVPGSWPIYSNSVDDMGWLDSERYVWTNFDTTFGLMPRVLLQKARVGDRYPTELSVNPIQRYNQNLGLSEAYLFPNGPKGEDALPKIAVSIPVGFPVGLYSQRMEVIEDSNGNSLLDVDGGDTPIEAMSNPTLDLKFSIREFRLTNGYSARTAPAIDLPTAGNTQGQTFSNQQPTGMRTFDGALISAWTSPRPDYTTTTPPTSTTDPNYRIYFSTLQGQTPNNAGGNSPLKDLGYFQPATPNRWMRQEFGPYPNLPNYDALFQSGTGESVIVGSEKFGAPAFPVAGQMDPMRVANFNETLMAFIGQAQKQSASGRNTEYRLMVSRVRSDSAGTLVVDNLAAMPYDPNSTKSRPSIYQVQNGAVIFYSSAGTGDGQIFYTVTDGSTFTKPSAISVGDGFESVSLPSVQLRPYGNSSVIEMVFSGKLHGRANPEIYYGRIDTRSTTINSTNIANTPNGPIYLTAKTGEVMTQDSEAGTYRAQGVAWNPRAPIHVYQVLNGVITDLEAGNRTVDRESGLIRFDSKLGGQIQVDPNMGSVRFTSTVPSPKARVLVDYTPRFLRVSESTVAGNVAPTIVWDDRIAGDISNYSYWFDIISGGALQNVPANRTPRTARDFITYTRAASGAGQAARPYWKSLRMGVQLTSKILTDAGGNLVNVTIQGPAGLGPVQIDPARARIYFQAGDENKSVTITYTAADETGQTGPVLQEKYVISPIVERTEQAVPIDQVVNESALAPFLDPFDQPLRPGLIWMLFVSTRAGSPDLYFQTMAPKFTPVVKTN